MTAAAVLENRHLKFGSGGTILGQILERFTVRRFLRYLTVFGSAPQKENV